VSGVFLLCAHLRARQENIMLNPQFGSGVLYGIPNAGNTAPNPTPMQFGILQEVQLEFKGALKKLYGTQQFALAIARGKIDVSGKGKIASLDPMFYSQLFFGLPTTAGLNRPVYNEAHAAAASVSTANAEALSDLGVIVTGGTGFSVGTQLTNSGVSAPATGQYKFTAWTGTSPGAWQDDHVYALNATILDPAGHTQKVTTAGTSGFALPTFNDSASTTIDGTVTWTDQGLSGVGGSYAFFAGDVSAGLTVALNYVWQDVDHGVTLSLTNQLMGYAPQFQALLYNSFRGQMLCCQLNACVLGTLQIPTKQEDFWVSDFDFEASADFSGNIGAIYADQL
jgi:hypothetical protein